MRILLAQPLPLASSSSCSRDAEKAPQKSQEMNAEGKPRRRKGEVIGMRARSIVDRFLSGDTVLHRLDLLRGVSLPIEQFTHDPQRRNTGACLLSCVFLSSRPEAPEAQWATWIGSVKQKVLPRPI